MGQNTYRKIGHRKGASPLQSLRTLSLHTSGLALTAGKHAFLLSSHLNVRLKVLNSTLMKTLIQYFIYSEKGGAGTNTHAYKGPFWISTRVKVVYLISLPRRSGCRPHFPSPICLAWLFFFSFP